MIVPAGERDVGGDPSPRAEGVEEMPEDTGGRGSPQDRQLSLSDLLKITFREPSGLPCSRVMLVDPDPIFDRDPDRV